VLQCFVAYFSFLEGHGSNASNDRPLSWQIQLHGCRIDDEGCNGLNVFSLGECALTFSTTRPCAVEFEFLENRLCFSRISPIGDNVFPIGVYSQPMSSIATWRSRGVNTMVSNEAQGGAVSVRTWSNAVARAGLFQIRKPLSNSKADLAADVHNASLLAWEQPDEPDLVKTKQSALAANYKAWKSTPDAKPVFTNLAGGNVMGIVGAVSAAAYQTKFLPYGDIICNDLYPVTGWDQPNWINYDAGGRHVTEGTVIDKLAQLSNGKPQWSVIETSNQNLAWTARGTRGVYPQEFRGEFWDSVIHGSSGVVYFPQQFNGFQYDATPSAVVDEMRRESNLINGTNYGTQTQGAIASILHLSADPTSRALQMKLGDARLEGTKRTSADGSTQYFVVLNRSWNGQVASEGNDTTRDCRVDLPDTVAAGTAVTALPDPTITADAAGNATTTAGRYRTLVAQKDAAGHTYVIDAFAAFAVHIYRVGTSSVQPATASRPLSAVVRPAYDSPSFPFATSGAAVTSMTKTFWLADGPLGAVTSASVLG
jgi:hypothetical protein